MDMKQMCVSIKFKVLVNESVTLNHFNVDPKIHNFSLKNQFSLMVILEHADFKIELWLLVYLKKFGFTLLQVEEVNLSLLYTQKKCDQQNH